MTIEERANALYSKHTPADRMDAPVEEAYAQGAEFGYIQGATEQREIDIKRAKYIFYQIACNAKSEIDSAFAFDSVERAMKGEEYEKLNGYNQRN